MISARSRSVLLLLAFSALLFAGKLAQAENNYDLRQRGIQAMEARNFAVARQTFLQLVQREPSAANYYYLATVEAAAGQVDLAVAHLQKSIQFGNRTASAQYNLGLLEMQAHQVDSAKAAFQEAIDLDPKYLPARYGLGVALLSSGHPHEAAALIEKTLEQRPHDARFWALLVSAQFAAGDSEKAIASTQSAMEDFPEEPRLDVTLATVCLRYHMVQRARELLENADELMPKDPEVALLLAKASLMAGEPPEALAVLQGVAPADRKSPERLLLMGETRALLGDLNSATDDLRMALNDSPRDPECLVAYAWLQNLQGNFAAAITTLAKARSLLPKAPWIPYGKAVSYYFLGKYGQAENACQEALQLDSKYAPAYMLRGMAKLKQMHFEAARMDMAKAVEGAPDNPLFHRELGIALYDSGKAALASEQFDFALRGNPKDAELYFWRAKSLQARGEKEKAIADLNTVIALQPGYAEAYTELAQIYSEKGQPARAAEVLAQQKQVGAPSHPSGDDPLLHTLPDATP
jgi:tetratricopeptide (TPR) repeat protein